MKRNHSTLMGRDNTFSKHHVVARHCRVCGNSDAVIGLYHLNICRQCFRENAAKLGFKKYH